MAKLNQAQPQSAQSLRAHRVSERQREVLDIGPGLRELPGEFQKGGYIPTMASKYKVTKYRPCWLIYMFKISRITNHEIPNYIYRAIAGLQPLVRYILIPNPITFQSKILRNFWFKRNTNLKIIFKQKS